MTMTASELSELRSVEAITNERKAAERSRRGYANSQAESLRSLRIVRQMAERSRVRPWGPDYPADSGMSKRDYFAGQALGHAIDSVTFRLRAEKTPCAVWRDVFHDGVQERRALVRRLPDWANDADANEVARAAVRIADALIAELNKPAATAAKE
jgi:hypothetical protein